MIVHIPPLPGMVLLKLIAWSDRPEERDNDLSDILKIIQHYYDLSYDEILDYHQDLISDGPIDELMIASGLLGRKSRHFLEKSEKLKQRLQKVLEKISLKHLNPESHGNGPENWTGILNMRKLF